MNNRDVLIVGAGPAGATAGTLLARAGLDVEILDKTSFPRFHIGESLLPIDLALFAKLGLDMQQLGFLYKGGAEFFDESCGEHAQYLFKDGLPDTPDHAYQVERASFDSAVLGCALRGGATFTPGVRAQRIEPDADGVVVHTSQGPLRARFVIDASGQDALLAHRTKSLQRSEAFGRAAVYCHFDQLADGAWRTLAEHGSGNIRVLIVDAGWMWIIPLAGKRLSVGLVTRKRGVDSSMLSEAVAHSPMLRELTHGAAASAPQIARNFSYVNGKPWGPRWASVGDAALFLDPVFSSGVSLAMLGAEQLSEALITAFALGNEADPTLTRSVSAHMQTAYDTFACLVTAFYHTKLVQHFFFAREPPQHLRQGLITMLAGDVWRNDNAFQAMLLSSKRRRFAWPEKP